MTTFFVGANDNDGDKLGAGAWSSSGTTITLGDSVGSKYTLAVRFTGITIPSGSTINTATLKGYTDSVGGQSGSELVRTKIYGIDEDNTADFSTDPTGRTKTTASTDWDFEPQASTASHTSPSIVTAVQEIIDRAGWSSGNAMGFLIVDDGSDTVRQIFESFEGDATKDFEFTVTWTGPVTTTTTSSSSTTTTSTSTSTSTTTQIREPNYARGIMRVTKEGKDVIDSNFLDDYFFDSNYPLLKVHAFGTFSTNTLGVEEITHNLGYIPYVIVFSQYLENDGGGGVIITDEYHQHDWYLDGATYYSYGYTKVYDDKIVITIENINTPNPGFIDGFYYIFKDEVI